MQYVTSVRSTVLGITLVAVVFFLLQPFAASAAGNLIANPDMEIANGSSPASWLQGGWGTNTAVFTYPTPGATGNGAKIQITAFTSGDIKWYFTPVAVTAGQAYTYADDYQSTASSIVVAQYTTSAGVNSYVDLGNAPAAATFTHMTRVLTVPAGITTMTVFHGLAAVGTLTIDNGSLTSNVAGDVTPPVVSLTAPAAGATISATTTFSATATDNVAVAGVQFFVDGVAKGVEDTTSPYSIAFNTTALTNGAHTIAARARDTSGNVATSTSVSVTVSNSTSTPDTQAPTVSITAPLAGSTLSGSGLVTATAADNVGVVGVQFYVDGVATQAEDTTAPYSITLDTTTLTNTSHTIAARARDLAGNAATSTVSVTVSNTTSGGGTNLIANPALEIANGTLPASWAQGGWGTNTAVFTYPTPGQSGNGAKLQITAFTNGDAKWYFTPVAVTAGQTYTFADDYQSTAASIVVAQYATAANVFSYVDLGNAPAAATFTHMTRMMVIPSGITSATVFHGLAAVGTLTIDNTSLSTGTGTSTPPADTQAPTINLTAPIAGSTLANTTTFSATASDNVGVVGVQFLVDGAAFGVEDTTAPYSLSVNTTSLSNGPHTVAARARDLAGNASTTPVVNITVANATSTGDIQAPTVSLTAPAANAVLIGTSTPISATAADNVGVASVSFLIDNVVYNTSSTSPYSFLIDTTTLTNGVHTIVAQAKDTSNNIGTSTPVSVTVNNPVPDTQAPVISILNPIGASIVAGTTTLTMSATDNVGVTSVHYAITGGVDVTVGQLTTAPYTVQIPARALINGPHTITAYAVDAAGNIGNATSVTYNTFYTPPTPLNPNLILNPSLETATAGLPDHWSQGSWGTSSTTFNYPVPGIDGAAAAQISVTSYTNGDAKWYFDDATVTPGQSYTFTDQYTASIPTTLTARYTLSDGTFLYTDILTNVPASNSWATVSQAFVPPASTTKVTIFHLINGVGALTIDNAALRVTSGSVINPGPNAFPAGFVSLTFDDGWGSQYDTAVPILNTAGLKGSFFIITNSMKDAVNQNRISNPSFEAAQSSTTPSGWTAVKTGVATTTFSYPVPGFTGNAAKITTTAYTSGDASWHFADTTIVSGQAYNYTDEYMATVPTIVTARYTLTNNTTQTVDLGTVPAAAVWTIAAFTFTPPTNIKTVTIYHRLAAVGSLTIDDTHLDIAQDYMNTAQVQSIFASGHEVSAHTRTHPYLTQLTTAAATDEILGSKQDLLAAGITPVDTFVFPYGDYNDAVIQIVKNSGYIASRTVDQGYNDKATDKYKLMIQEVNASTTAATWEQWTQTAVTNKTWLILMYHQIDHSGDQYGATPEDLQTYVNYLTANGIPVLTMKQGLALMNP